MQVDNKQLQAALDLVDELSKHGEAYIVGGFVRDRLLGIDSHDIDIATNVSEEHLRKFDQYDLGKNKTFGVTGIKYKNFTFEVAQFRTESDYTDGRHPDQVKIVQTLEEDIKRRDFTINALAFNKNLEIIDYVGGQEDLKKEVIRTVGAPIQRFSEDYLRMLRALRFAAKFEFVIEQNTLEAIKQLKNNITKISVERVWQEIWKAASSANFGLFIRHLKITGLLEVILPEIHKLEFAEHTKETHPEGLTAYTHTLAAIDTLMSINPLVNLGILFHDVGKFDTHGINEDGKPTYYDHDNKGAEIVEKICDRFKVDNNTKEILMFSTKNHMLFAHLPIVKNSRCIAMITHKGFEVLKEVTHADIICRGFKTDIKEWQTIEQKIVELDAVKKYQDWLNQFKQIINGHVVMQERNVNGPEIGRIIKATLEWVQDNSIDLVEKEKILEFMRKV